MSLKDFRNNASDLPREDDDNHIQSSLYLQELNTLKIDKLSNRVTIISVMLPVLIGAVLFFIYLDIKDQMVDADLSKKDQVEYMARQSEEKLNALDVRIAKNRFDLDEKLPQLEKKGQSLENQVAKLAGSKADTAALDADIDRLEDILAKHDHRIQNNAAQDKATLAQLERINTSLLSAIAQNQDRFEKDTQPLKQEIKSLKKTVETEITDLQRLKKDLSLLDKQIKNMETQGMTRRELEQRLADLKTGVEKAVKALEKKIKNVAAQPGSSPDTLPSQKNSTQTRPIPQLDLETAVPDSISEETLTQ
ncbi:MAG: hypothetical protein K9K21_01085 [Desulfotignum sp.]|nr:hypothetical protein [Desulfotignum sp.]MCF8112425.1 hypothetical protein [Desulfotignum sp.]MCF8124762.1 hypothetical protein [Desulfotignum sp.]